MRRLRRWLDLGVELVHEIQSDRLQSGAAALAFYSFLAIFPAAIFALSLLPYLPIPRLGEAIMDLVRQALPPEAANVFTSNVDAIVSSRSGGLVSFGFLLTLWSASSGLYAVMQQLNQVFEVEEGRSFVRARAVALLLTIVFFVLVVGALTLVAGGGVAQAWLADRLGWGDALLWLFAAFRWGVVLVALDLAFAVVYWRAPNVVRPFELVTAGTTLATLGLLAASYALRVYVAHFGDYDAVYGGLGAVIVLMMWLFVAGFVMLVGAELDQVLRRRRSPPSEVEAIEEAAAFPT